MPAGNAFANRLGLLQSIDPIPILATIGPHNGVNRPQLLEWVRLLLKERLNLRHYIATFSDDVSDQILQFKDINAPYIDSLPTLLQNRFRSTTTDVHNTPAPKITDNIADSANIGALWTSVVVDKAYS